jgi:sensor histidine kinase YesM
VRFGSRIAFTLEVAPGVPLDTPLPKMLMQGYVSNAIKHGLEHKPEGGTIRIGVDAAGGYLRITVEDDGVGLEKARQYRRRGTGQGLAINQAIFEQLNQYNGPVSYQQITDLTDPAHGAAGVRQEACLPLFPVLPPEEVTGESR